MVSGVGFKNTVDEDKKGSPRKKTVSLGLLVAVGFLMLVLVVFGLLKIWNKSLDQKLQGIKSTIDDTNMQVHTTLSEEASDFAVRSMAMEDEIYREYDSNDILHEIENIMILKESDNSGERVVLKTFQYNAGALTKKTVSGQKAVSTGMGSVTITADADSFDVMAQQIEAFKKSIYFDNVRVGTTDRDDFGRIIFTLTMDVTDYDKSPYEDDENITNVETNEMPGMIIEPDSTQNIEQIEAGDANDVDNDIEMDTLEQEMQIEPTEE